MPGSLLNQFSLSEHEGILRAATTVGFGPDAESRVTTLERRDGRLVKRGDVGGLGRGERIYAVRFIGDVGYVVTFRQVDPLYTIDLADPDRPRVLGELKIPGYSAYLHPVGDDLLLGVGQDATDQGRLQGLQISLFDVSDLARPARLQQLRLGERWSSVRGRVGPPRVPVVAGDEARGAADRQQRLHRRGRLPRRPRGRHRRGRPRRATSGRRRRQPRGRRRRAR